MIYKIMERKTLENVLNRKIDCKDIKLTDLPTNEIIEILGLKRCNSIYLDKSYAVYTSHGKFFANKQMRQFFPKILGNMLENGMLIPPTKFTFVCLPKKVAGDHEYVPIVFLEYPNVKAPRLDSYFLKYPGEHNVIPHTLLPKMPFKAIGYDASGALYVKGSGMDGIWVSGNWDKNLDEINEIFDFQ